MKSDQHKTRLKLRTTAYPSRADLQPFINGHEKLTHGHVDENSPVALEAMSSRVPINEQAIKLGKAYREVLPTLLKDKLDLTRNFFLNEIAPYLLACSNGLQDARDVLVAAFEEEADVDPLFAKIENAVGLAMDIRILNFAKTMTGLSETEARQFMTIAFSKELKTNEDITGKLLDMLSLSNLPGTAKGTKVPVRRLPEAKVDRKPARTRRAGARSKG